MKPIIEAHRGFSGRFPENTLVAFREAVSEGVQSIELDIHTSKDGHLIVMHDGTVDRTTNGSGKISDMTLAELKALDAGFKKGVKGEPIPTLDETFELTDKSGVAFNVEVKKFSDDTSAKKLVALLDGHKPAEGNFHVVSSFDANALLQVREAGAKVPLCMLGDNAAKILEIAKENKFEWIHSHFASVTPEIVQAAHDAGIKVMIWTLDDATAYKTYADMGVDKICTNWCREMLAAERISIILADEADGKKPQPPKSF